MKNTIKYPQPKRRSSSYFDVGHLLRTVFTPNEHNNHRPLLVRSWVILLVVSSFLIGQLSAGIFSGNSVLAGKDDLPPIELLQDTNKLRKKAGIQPLVLDDDLTAAAAAKADDMITHQYWDHVSPEGVEPWHWIVKTGYGYKAAGENLAKNFRSADTTISAWNDSPLHRDNMLNEHYSDVGFATSSGQLDGKSVTITVAMYGEPIYAGMVLASAPKVTYAGNSNFTSSGTNSVLGVADRVELAALAMPPLVVGVLFLLLIMIIVLLLAHIARRQLPRSHVRNQIRYHHAFIKGLGISVFIVSIFWLYGGGQI